MDFELNLFPVLTCMTSYKHFKFSKCLAILALKEKNPLDRILWVKYNVFQDQAIKNVIHSTLSQYKSEVYIHKLTQRYTKIFH